MGNLSLTKHARRHHQLPKMCRFQFIPLSQNMSITQPIKSQIVPVTPGTLTNLKRWPYTAAAHPHGPSWCGSLSRGGNEPALVGLTVLLCRPGALAGYYTRVVDEALELGCQSVLPSTGSLSVAVFTLINSWPQGPSCSLCLRAARVASLHCLWVLIYAPSGNDRTASAIRQGFVPLAGGLGCLTISASVCSSFVVLCGVVCSCLFAAVMREKCAGF